VRWRDRAFETESKRWRCQPGTLLFLAKLPKKIFGAARRASQPWAMRYNACGIKREDFDLSSLLFATS
jgi:hypothetical protein